MSTMHMTQSSISCPGFVDVEGHCSPLHQMSNQPAILIHISGPGMKQHHSLALFLNHLINVQSPTIQTCMPMPVASKPQICGSTSSPNIPPTCLVDAQMYSKNDIKKEWCIKEHNMPLRYPNLSQNPTPTPEVQSKPKENKESGNNKSVPMQKVKECSHVQADVAEQKLAVMYKTRWK